MPDIITIRILVIFIWCGMFVIPFMGMRAKRLTGRVVWMRFRMFVPVVVVSAFTAGGVAGMMSGMVAVIPYFLNMMMATTWLFLTNVIFHSQD
jgi:hypothetical protein